MKDLKRWGLVIVIGLLAAGLRLWQLGTLPPSLYWEEVALGYDAFSLASTGRDHHGHFLPIVALESFGDYKPALYAYLIVPFIKMLGLNAWSVRLPSALAGLAIVWGVGVLTQKLLSLLTAKEKSNLPLGAQLPLVVAAITAISPWAVQFSRGGWEVNLATALILCGVLCGVRLWTMKVESLTWYTVQLLSVVLTLVASLYTYHAARVVAPVMGLAIVAKWGWDAWQRGAIRVVIIPLVISGTVGLLVTAPLLLKLNAPEVRQRIAETSIFTDLSVIEESNARQQAHPGLMSKLLYHRYALFSREVARNYLSHFRVDFLFLSGDENARHSVQFFGLLYPAEFIFLVIGMGVSVRYWRRGWWLLWLWVGLGILPAAITKASPHALRILPTLPVWMVWIGLGVVSVFQWLIEKKATVLTQLGGRKLNHLIPAAVASVLVLSYLGQWLMYWRFYTRIYPVLYAQDWQYGYQQMVAQVNQWQSQHQGQPIYITREQGRPAMYYWFFSQTEPRLVQAAQLTTKKDQGEFLEFGQLKFINTTAEVTSAGLVVSSVPGLESLQQRHWQLSPVGEVRHPKGEVIWVIYEAKESS